MCTYAIKCGGNRNNRKTACEEDAIGNARVGGFSELRAAREMKIERRIDVHILVTERECNRFGDPWPAGMVDDQGQFRKSHATSSMGNTLPCSRRGPANGNGPLVITTGTPSSAHFA